MDVFPNSVQKNLKIIGFIVQVHEVSQKITFPDTYYDTFDE